MFQPVRLTVASAVFLFSTLASAQQLNHAGGFCRAFGGTAVYYNQGAIGNDSYSQTMGVLCPVVRRSGQATSGTPKVHTIDRSSTAGIECSYYDVRSYAHNWDWSGWTTSVGGSVNNYRTFSFGNGTNDDSLEGFHHFYCKIPPKDATHGVSIIGSYNSGD